MFEKFLDFLFPPRCPICGDDVALHGQVCIKCWGEFNWISDPMCEKCGYPFPADVGRGENMLCPNCVGKKTKLDRFRAAAVYDDAARAVMLPFKHGGRLEFQEPMAKAMIAALRDLDLGKNDKDLVVLPVPLALRRLWKRGYNQAALLARPIAKHLGAKVDYDSVRRKFRADMGHKHAAARQRNIAGVFRVRRPDKIRGRKILLVDDVRTTGATWVGGVAFCRTVRAI